MRSLLILLLSCSCTSLPAIVDLPGGGFVRARTPELAREYADRLIEASPRVIARLGTRNERPPVLIVRGVVASGGPMGSVNDWTSLRLKEDAPPEFLYHELVHWHAVGPWDTLPLGVEEGLASVIGLELSDEDLGITIHPPDPDLLERILEHDPWTWRKERALTKYDAAAWIYAVLGFDELWLLACRAEAAGLERIPRDWLEIPPLDTIYVRGFSMTSGSGRCVFVGPRPGETTKPESASRGP